jgi:hypothetical protein
MILLDSEITEEVVFQACPICGGLLWNSGVMWWAVLWGVGLTIRRSAQEKSSAMTILGRLPAPGSFVEDRNEGAEGQAFLPVLKDADA